MIQNFDFEAATPEEHIFVTSTVVNPGQFRNDKSKTLLFYSIYSEIIHMRVEASSVPHNI